VLAAAGRLLVGQDGEAVVGWIIRELGRSRVRAIDTIENQNAATQTPRIQRPLFARLRHGK
jgi:hypothetical protein